MVCGGLLLFIPRPAAGPLGALLTVLCLTAAATTWRDAAPMRAAAQPAMPASKSPASPSPAPVVTATTGLVTIESDRQMADNSTGIVTAIGNVRIVYPDQRVVATARQAQYFSREGRVVLSGQVSVIQDDGHSLRAEQLVYLVNQERLEARPAAGQQVLSRYNLAAPTPSSPASGDRP
jgi:lipopolysaccharide export system protein LptA